MDTASGCQGIQCWRAKRQYIQLPGLYIHVQICIYICIYLYKHIFQIYIYICTYKYIHVNPSLRSTSTLSPPPIPQLPLSRPLFPSLPLSHNIFVSLISLVSLALSTSLAHIHPCTVFRSLSFPPTFFIFAHHFCVLSPA